MNKREQTISIVTAFPDEVPAGGFEWWPLASDVDFLGPWISESKAPGKPAPIEITDNLLAEFASLVPVDYVIPLVIDPERDGLAIVEFANRMGFLGFQMFVRPQNLVMELVDQWMDEILEIQDAMKLAAAIAEKRTSTLRKLIRIYPNRVVFTGRLNRHETPGREGRDKTQSKDFETQQFKPGQSLVAARFVLGELINQKLLKTTAVGTTLENGHLQPSIVAQSLLGMIWLQFMNSAADGRMRSCPVCGQVMNLIGKRPRKTCSDRCRKQLSLKNIAKKGRASSR